MAIKYIDIVCGDDISGDGSPQLPYQSILKATTGLVPDDEVRIAKSQEDTELPGEFTFTFGSYTVLTTHDMRQHLVANDYLYGDGEINLSFMVASTHSDHVTLNNKYIGATKTTTGHKVSALGPLATDATAVGVSGSLGHSIKISGGWNLSLLVQDGVTNVLAAADWCSVRGSYFKFQNINVWRANALLAGAAIVGIEADSINTDFCTLSAGSYSVSDSTISDCVLGVTKEITGGGDPTAFYINCTFTNITNRQSDNTSTTPITPLTPPILGPDPTPFLTEIATIVRQIPVPVSSEDKANTTYTDAGGEQIVYESTSTKRRICQGIWFDMSDFVTGGLFKIYYKVDGLTYRRVLIQPWVITDDPCVYFDLALGCTDALKLTWTESSDNTRLVTVPHSAIIQALE